MALSINLYLYNLMADERQRGRHEIVQSPVEAEKDKYNRAEATIPGIEVLANLFFSKKSQIKIFLETYAREFMKYFQNSDSLCIAFRNTLTKAHGLQIDYRIGSDGKMLVDQTMNQLFLFSFKKRVHTASVTEIIRMFEEELAVKFFLLELEKCLLTLFVKKFELKKLKLKFASGRNNTGIHFTHTHALKQLHTLETQIRVLKSTSQTYSSRYAAVLKNSIEKP